MARNLEFWHGICTIYTIESKFISERGKNRMSFKLSKSQKRVLASVAKSSPNLVRMSKSGKGSLSMQQVRVQQGAVSRNHYL